MRLASDFLAAAQLQDLDQNPPSMVTYFLLGHALELAFKSVLIAHGTSERNLRSMDHDLRVVTDAAVQIAPAGVIQMDACESAQLECLGPFYEAKAFEYLLPGFMSLPTPRELYHLAERLAASINRFVEAHVRSSIRNG
jgi:hypothetical protein